MPCARLAMVVAFSLAAWPALAAPATDKPVKTLINAIRYGKDDLAAKQIAFLPMVERLLGETWAQLSADEQKELAAGLEVIIRARSFAKGKDTFKHLDALLFAQVRQEAGDTRVKSTIVIHRDYKKTELVIDWVLLEHDGAWKVVDIVMLGESTLAGIREDEVEPLLHQGGPAALMRALRAKVAEAKKG